jgi:hypothetical protein
MEIRAGDVVAYYPRRGKSGHFVKILEVRSHPFHRAIVRFQYQGKAGHHQSAYRVREITISRFHTTPS